MVFHPLGNRPPLKVWRAFLYPYPHPHTFPIRDPDCGLAGHPTQNPLCQKKILCTLRWATSAWTCLFWARGNKTREASSSPELSTASKVWFLPSTVLVAERASWLQWARRGRTDQVPCAWGRGGSGWDDSIEQQQHSSSRKPPQGHLLRSDPFSWEKQHKRQHGFPF